MTRQIDDYSDLPLFAKEEHFFVRSQLVRERAMPSIGLTSSEEAAKYIREQIGDYDREAFLVLGLNQRHRLNVTSIVHIGSATESIADAADIARVALYSNSTNIIIAHNHPSGVSSPSPEDQKLTQRVKAVVALLNIRLLDHIIIGAGEYYSFADQGAL